MNRDLELRNFVRLPPELFSALGEVSVRYGQIEHLLTMTIHRTAGLSYDDAFARVKDLKSRDDVRKEAKKCFEQWAIKEFGKTDGLSRSEDFNLLIKEWGKGDGTLADRRDNVIHCCWTEKDEQLGGTRKGLPLTRDGHPLGITDIEKLAEDLKDFVVKLNSATKTEQSGPEDVMTTMETTATCAATPMISSVGSAIPLDD